jgi:hypothetical protein
VVRCGVGGEEGIVMGGVAGIWADLRISINVAASRIISVVLCLTRNSCSGEKSWIPKVSNPWYGT